MWHSVGTDASAETMLHNTKLRQGMLFTGDVLRPFVPEGTIISQYSWRTVEREKEDVWEAVRREEFPQLPSRHECLFLFDNPDCLNTACQDWWRGETRRTLIANIMPGSIIHRGDTRWLNAHAQDWEANAKAYWNGQETATPLFEIVVQGTVFFPEWESFPALGMGWQD